MAITIGNTGGPPAPVTAPASQNSSPAPAGSGAKVVAVQAPEPVAQQAPQPAQVQKAIQALKQLIETKAPNTLAFSVDGSSGRTVVKITDRETGETIRQIPSEELLEIAKSLDKLQGMLVQQKV